MAQQRQQVIIQSPPGPSAFSITGLVFSILGWFTCGLLCIPGAFFCLLALFGRGSKAVPIAGLIIGFPGTIFFGFVGLGMILTFLGIGAAATTTTASVAVGGLEIDSTVGGLEIDSTVVADFQGSGETSAAQPKSGTQESVIDKLLKERTEAFDSEMANWQEESLKIQDSIDELEGQLRTTREAAPKKPVFESRVWRAQGGFEATGSLLITDNVTFKIKKSDGSTSPEISKQKVAAEDQAYLEMAFRKLTKYSQDQESYDETIKQLQGEIDEQNKLASNLENSKPVAPKRSDIVEETKLQNDDNIEQQSNTAPQSDQQKKD